MKFGFPEYAPELASHSEGFRPEFFADLAQIEETHFWFQARRRLLVWALRKYRPSFRSLLEIGCGTGYLLSGLATAFPGTELHGSEVLADGLNYVLKKQPSIGVMQMDARRIPFVEEFDVVGAFDVLEHIREDETVLSQVRAALKPGGLFLATVPQHPWLWSSVDSYSCHVRRYRAEELHEKLRRAGFALLRSTSFVSLPLPLMLLARLRKNSGGAKADQQAELQLPPSINRLLAAMMGFEFRVIRSGGNFPLGGSRLVVARKQ